MTYPRERATALLAERNVRAWLRVIRSGESSQEDDAYRMHHGGRLESIPPWRHPYYGKTTTEVGHSTAFGAYQFLGTSAKEALDALNLDNVFDPATQDLCAVWTIDVKRHAMDDVLAGNLVAACAKLKDEWVALQTMPYNRVIEVFLEYGGDMTPQNAPQAPQIPQPIPTQPEEPENAPERDLPPPEKPMPLPALALLGPILQMVPGLIAALGKGEQAQRNSKAAEVVVNAFTAAVPGAVNAQDAIERAQADPVVREAAKAAVLSDPAVAGLMEVGGGIAAARKAASDPAQAPLYRNGAFLMSLLLLPMAYLVVSAVMFNWGAPFADETRSAVVNLVLGMVLGSLVGFWLGSSLSSSRKTELLAERR